MSSSYQPSKTHVKYKATKGKPKPSKEMTCGPAKHFVPSKADCSGPGQSFAGKPGKGFMAEGTG